MITDPKEDEDDGTRTFIAVRVVGKPHGDWLGQPGRLFRRAITALAKFCRRHPDALAAVDAAGKMAQRRIEGEASAKYAGSVRDFATAEAAKIEAEIARRSATARVEQAEALVKKTRAEAEKVKVEAQLARLDLIERLQKCGVVPIRVGPSEFMMHPINKNFTPSDLKMLRRFLIDSDADDLPGDENE